jgi:hypothetical protein
MFIWINIDISCQFSWKVFNIFKVKYIVVAYDIEIIKKTIKTN